MYCITLTMPDDKGGKLKVAVMTKHYYTGLVKLNGQDVHSWDTDKQYSKQYKTKLQAKKIRSWLLRTRGHETCKVELFENNNKDYLRIIE